jgi:hypothetical protein
MEEGAVERRTQAGCPAAKTNGTEPWGPFKWQKERRQDRNAMVTRVSGLSRVKNSSRKIGQAIAYLTVARFFSKRTRASHSWLIEHELMSPVS